MEKGIQRVEYHNHRIPDPKGDNPRCKNKLWTWVCEHCGGDVRKNKGSACPASKPEERWRT